ncbi:MAG: GAF domain-containing protein, partial [Chloroflexia bacterium]|nr:GAF domain-containing protein [Chloroflexia bacterium]
MENTGAASGGPPAHDRDGHQQPEIDELRRQLRQAAFTADIGRALTRGDSLADLLQRCAMAIVAHLDAAFARVWTLRAGADVLVLQASAGLYTHLDGPHGRIPVGALKIGRIAATRQPHLTNDVLTDPYISDHAWAAREGMAAFAGYPLQVDDRLVGVMALFARHPLSPDTLATLSSVADMVAFGIDRARLDEAARR